MGNFQAENFLKFIFLYDNLNLKKPQFVYYKQNVLFFHKVNAQVD